MPTRRIASTIAAVGMLARDFPDRATGAADPVAQLLVESFFIPIELLVVLRPY